jgi:ubiquinone/menaquinone biosynthesis C-methylase UbiE
MDKEIRLDGKCTARSRYTIDRRLSKFFNLIEVQGSMILDLGCNQGIYSEELSSLAKYVVGIEPDYHAIFIAANNKTLSNQSYINARAEDIPIKNNSFDVVFLNEVIEHIPNQEKALNEIYRILKSKGILYISAPNRLYPFETHKYKLGQMNIPKYIPFIPWLPLFISRKIFVFSARNYFPWELKKLVENFGFKFKKRDFYFQSFDDLLEKSKRVPSGVTFIKLLRKCFLILENILIVKWFSVSQILVFEKQETLR